MRAHLGSPRVAVPATALALAVAVPAAYAGLNTHDTAEGTGALGVEAGGDSNSAFGWSALAHNAAGFFNSAFGESALY
jgi:hypothetical protein